MIHFCCVQVARNLVSDQLLPALEDSQLGKAAREAAKQLSHLDVKNFPLGFSTGGEDCMHVQQHAVVSCTVAGSYISLHALQSRSDSEVESLLQSKMCVVDADSKTDAAATILRMLYIKDLRGLQTLIDETLVNVQASCEVFVALRCAGIMMCLPATTFGYAAELHSQPKDRCVAWSTRPVINTAAAQ